MKLEKKLIKPLLLAGQFFFTTYMKMKSEGKDDVTINKYLN
jgi:hypothetical protein